MFDNHHSGKIKNDKILRWRIELSSYKYDIIYRPGKENKGADTFSLMVCSAMGTLNTLTELHNNLCHPGISRMSHFVRTRNLPFSTDEIKRMTSSCPICRELKPQFHKSSGTLIHATQPFQRLNIDFKGPLPSVSRNRYILTVVDEYSRFPFAFPCSDMNTSTVIKCFDQLFAIFGMPGYIQ